MPVVAELNSSILPRLGMVARFLVARNVMFSGKQTTAHKMADQLKNCINQRAHGFYSNRIHTAGSVWITDTITNVMIHYNTSLNFSFKLSTFYLASILFTWLKFTCVNVRSQNASVEINLKTEDGDGSAIVAVKVNSSSFNIHRDYSRSLTLSNVGESS